MPDASRARVVAAIARLELRTVTVSIGGYVALTAAILAATLVLYVDIRTLAENGFLVSAQPLALPLAIALLTLALFQGISAATSVARDRESGTLEVLFYGPVDTSSYILGKIVGHLAAYALTLPVLLSAIWALGAISGFGAKPSLLLLAVFSLAAVAEIVAIATLVSVCANRAKSALQILVGVSLLFVGITIAHRMSLLIAIDDPASPLLALRETLRSTAMVVRWISPFAHIEQLSEQVASGSGQGIAWSVGCSLALATLIGTLATLVLAFRGVSRGEGSQ